MESALEKWLADWTADGNSDNLRFGQIGEDDVVFTNRAFKRGQIVAFDKATFAADMPHAVTGLFANYTDLVLPGLAAGDFSSSFDKKPYTQRADIKLSIIEERIVDFVTQSTESELNGPVDESKKATADDDGFIVVAEAAAAVPAAEAAAADAVPAAEAAAAANAVPAAGAAAAADAVPAAEAAAAANAVPAAGMIARAVADAVPGRPPSKTKTWLVDQLRAFYRYATLVPGHDGKVSSAVMLSFVPVMRRSTAYNASTVFVRQGAFLVAERDIPANSEICVSPTWTGAALDWLLSLPACRAGDCPAVSTVMAEAARSILLPRKQKRSGRSGVRSAVASFGPLLILEAVSHRNTRVIKSISSIVNDCKDVSDSWRRGPAAVAAAPVTEE